MILHFVNYKRKNLFDLQWNPVGTHTSCWGHTFTPITGIAGASPQYVSLAGCVTLLASIVGVTSHLCGLLQATQTSLHWFWQYFKGSLASWVHWFPSAAPRLGVGVESTKFDKKSWETTKAQTVIWETMHLMMISSSCKYGLELIKCYFFDKLKVFHVFEI